ncbi:MAG: MBL fold metallo-hydrolase [Pseudomonadales bacterium]|nr:MBL fold metallo-hydrolase [Pseudomonadales bacterium]
MNRRLLSLALVVVALAAAGLYHWRAPLSVLLVPRFAQERFAAQPLQALADGLHVGLCGAGSPFPDPQRSAPCTLVIAGTRLLVFDAGITAAPTITRMGFDPGQIEALFLTHFHSDHIGGLGEVMLQRWGTGSHTEPLPVYGPIGVKSVVDGFMQAYRQDHLYRIAHHGPQVMPPSGFGAQARTFAAVGPERRVVLIDEPDLQVVAFSVEHSPVEPAVGYRIRYKDRSLVISGDTRKSAAVQREAAGVDLLLHEALSPELTALLGRAAAAAGRNNLVKIFADIPDYHTTPEQAAEIARDAGVGYLLLNHIAPPLPIPGLQQAFLGQAETIYAGGVRVGIDGDFISLPTASKAIQQSNLL